MTSFARIVLATIAAAFCADVLVADPAEADLLTSAICAQCHSNAPGARAMRDPAGEGIAPVDVASASMMAAAAKDPVWRAVVSVETAATPSRRAEIEATCMRCHAPLASLSVRPGGTRLDMLDADDRIGRLGRDGASCMTCHRIEPSVAGAEQNWSGTLVLRAEREILGPHRDVFPMPMLHHTGFRPRWAERFGESTLCASCHTLITETFAADGTRTGATLPEQTPYLEWLNSSFAGGAGPGSGSVCADCHLPTVDDRGAPLRTAIARNPHGRDFGFARPREPFGRHLLLGGNDVVPTMLAAAARDEGAVERARALEEQAVRARDHLATAAATVEIGAVTRSGRTVSIPVSVRNRTGHKLPTGHPSRRVWLRLIVRDAAGSTVFASGAHDPLGRIVDGAGKPLPSELAGGPVLPHARTVRRETEVAIFESVMADAAGEPTHFLLRGASFHKDNRLLPAGWRSDGPGAGRTSPVGPSGDADFVGGQDTVVYRVAAPERSGPYVVEVDLLYQPLGARYVAEILTHRTPEVDAVRDKLRVRPTRLTGARREIAAPGMTRTGS